MRNPTHPTITNPTLHLLLSSTLVITFPYPIHKSCSDEGASDFVRACLDRVVYQSTPLISLPAIYNLPLPIQAIPMGGTDNMGGNNNIGGHYNTVSGNNNMGVNYNISGNQPIATAIQSTHPSNTHPTIHPNHTHLPTPTHNTFAPRMVSRYAAECIDTPDDSPGSYMYPTHHEKLIHRFVAVVKVGVRRKMTYSPFP